MVKQDNHLLAGWIQHYGCAGNGLAAYRELVMGNPWGVHEWGSAMHLAVHKGIISGDLNGDGDMDDPAESLIQDYQRLADHFSLPLKYLGKFDQTDVDKFSGPGYWVLVSWYNPRTKFIHWVIGNKRPVQSDSISGGSVTVAEGAPYPLQKDKDGNLIGGIRVFKVV